MQNQVFVTLGHVADLGNRRQVNIIRWNSGKPCIDIRAWDGRRPGKGIALTPAEAKRLIPALQACLALYQNFSGR